MFGKETLAKFCIWMSVWAQCLTWFNEFGKVLAISCQKKNDIQTPELLAPKGPKRFAFYPIMHVSACVQSEQGHCAGKLCSFTQGSNPRKKKGVHALKEVIQEKDQQIGVSC